MNTKTRFILLILINLIGAGIILLVQRGYSFSVNTPSQKLSSFPTRFDGWEGETEEITDGVATVLDATDMLSLRFVRGAEGPIFFHVSTWTNPDNVAETCPHHPETCYRGNGWTPKDSATLMLDIPPANKIPVQAIVMQRGDTRVVVAFTYRMGDRFFVDDHSARQAQLSFFGTSVWPAVTKVMVQTIDPNIDSAKPTIETFMRNFLSWHLP